MVRNVQMHMRNVHAKHAILIYKNVFSFTLLFLHFIIILLGILLFYLLFLVNTNLYSTLKKFGE